MRAMVRLAGAAAFLALAAAVPGQPATAQVTTEERSVTGYGANAQDAVLAALAEATLQVCGVVIRTRTLSEVEAVDDGELRITERLNRMIEATSGAEACRFEGYDVVATRGVAPDVAAEVRARYGVYRVPGPDMERRRIAVLEFPIGEVHLAGVGGGRERLEDGAVAERGVGVDFGLVRNLEDRFRAQIEAYLTQGRRFGVLDRDRPDVFEAERALLQSGDVDPRERARLGQVLGADYLVYGSVDRLAVEDRSEAIEITGEVRGGDAANLRVRFTVLAVATRQVKWSSSLVVDRGIRGAAHPEQLAEALLDEAAARIVDELTENIYPPKVTQVIGGGRFVVNRGGNTVAAGDLFEVFAVGEWLIDPDTGEKLDRLETSVAVARVREVKPKYSVAEVISEPAELARGMVLRRRAAPAEAAPVRPARSEPTFEDVDGDGIPDYLNRTGD